MHTLTMPLKHAMHIGKLGPSLGSKQLYIAQQQMYWQNFMVTSHTS
jgi:hypothetical protein